MRDALTLQLRKFLEEGGFFQEVNLLPGKPSEGDLVLRFDFKHFYQMREASPWYFPLALLTMGWYPILGGPVFVDASNLAGTLAIETPNGRRLASASHEIERRYHVSMWSSNYALPSGIEPRTEIIQELVDSALRDLPRPGALP